MFTKTLNIFLQIVTVIIGIENLFDIALTFSVLESPSDRGPKIEYT